MKNKILIGILVFVFTVVLIVGITASTLWSHRNEVVSVEEQINAQYVANKSNYDNMWKRFVEITQVTDLQAKQFKDVYGNLITGRYTDQKLLFKMVQESNPQLNTEVYAQLQREISAGRLQFDNNQKSIADMVREYNTLVRQYVVMSSLFHFEVKDANQFIVTSEKTTNAFDTKKDDAINLTGK